ncbi:MAG: cell envelope integrity protein TolA [Microbacter sp.]
MKPFLVAGFTLLFSVMLTSCVVTVNPGDTQDQGIYGYAYYYFPEYNVYYSPDLNRFWWYQWGSWQYGPQLPPWYVIDPDTYYLTITSQSLNPTRYSSYYQSRYQRGYYRNRLQQIRQAPEGRFPFYNPSNRQPGQEPPRNQPNPNYNNNGERKAIPSRSPEMIPSQPSGHQQNPYNEGSRREENRNVTPTNQHPTENRPSFQPNQNQQERRANPVPEQRNTTQPNEQKAPLRPIRQNENMRREMKAAKQQDEQIRREKVQEKREPQRTEKENQQR